MRIGNLSQSEGSRLSDTEVTTSNYIIPLVVTGVSDNKGGNNSNRGVTGVTSISNITNTPRV
jgi:hypothetical protein